MKMLAEKFAFQEEQSEVLRFLEQKRQEMEEHKVNFLSIVNRIRVIKFL